MKPKKSFGQNFLEDHSILHQIIDGARLEKEDWVVEIGPGTGVLTKELSQHVEKVVAIELDRDLIPELLNTFPLSSNVSIVEGDILKTDIIGKLQSLGYTGKPYKVIANIPYYITAPIIQKLLQLSPQPQEILLMVQKEVAERIVAQPGDMSILSLAVQYYADANILFSVPKTAFFPIPQVESAVVKIIPKRIFNDDDDKALFRLIHIGFSSRRKTLANNFASGLHLSKDVVTQKLKSVSMHEQIRAQALGIEDWIQLQQLF